MSAAKTFIGLDIGGTNIKALAFAPDGETLAEQTVATEDDGTGSWLVRARALAVAVLDRCPKPARVGVAAPGVPARDGRSIAVMPARLSGLVGCDWQEWLGSDTPVRVFNDAQAALLGQVWRGAARQATNALLLTLGTGVGGAAMVDGRILRGHRGRAGHLGHVSLNPDGAPDIANTPGSLEDAIGECTLAARSGGCFTSTQALVMEVRAGSPAAREIWLRSVRSLAAAIAGFINILDPEVVVLGGGSADADETLFAPLAAALGQFEWRPGGGQARLVKAALGRKAGAAGAAYGTLLAEAEATTGNASYGKQS